MNEPLRTRIKQLTANSIYLEKRDPWPAAVHHFTVPSLWALDMAIETGRPLLIRGEPGIGKSQIARAAAEVLKVRFLSFVVNERTERDDLLFHYDAVARLAAIQVRQSAPVSPSAEGYDGLPESLRENSFVRPGVLWWALNWKSAKRQADLFSRCSGPVRNLAPSLSRKASQGHCVARWYSLTKSTKRIYPCPTACLNASERTVFVALN
ncbi:hypothetical protein LBMAG46_38980 [Planctomycetia bacterium]|nr:hypothetical protein LBMAG46_38980 [Planctomycetia bacterium]